MGAFVGADDGFFVGPMVGFFVGDFVGAFVGADDGFFVGPMVGFFVGFFVGPFVGALVGAELGFLVGDFVGPLVGDLVGPYNQTKSERSEIERNPTREQRWIDATETYLCWGLCRRLGGRFGRTLLIRDKTRQGMVIQQALATLG